ncbi:MAG: hypothetical protein ACI3YK_04120 [Eubacteriales bacterium]
MKRILSLTLCLFLLLALPACGKKKIPLTDRGMEVVFLMNEVANSDIVKTTFSTESEAQYFLSEIRAGDYTQYHTVYEIGLPQNMDELILTAGYPESDLDNPSLYGIYEDTVPTYIWKRVNLQSNGLFLPSSVLAASSVYTAERLFSDSDLKMDTVYLYIFENGMPIAVCFTVGEGGAVLAQGQWILNSDFPTDTPENIRTFLEDLFPGCVFSVTPVEA